MIVTLALAAAASATLPGRRLAAIQAPRMDRPGPIIVYRARGQEPGWTLEIERRPGGKGEVARFMFDYGKGKATEVLRPPLAGRNGVRRWQSVSGRMTVGLTPRPCEDAMSGEGFPMTAFVTWGGQTYRGCGAPAIMTVPAAIEHVEWIVEDIGGRGIIDSSRVTIEIRKNGVAGRSGCNRYFGTAEVDGNRISFGQMGATRMACAPALMNQEQAFLTLLGTVQRWRIDATGALVMTAADGRTLRARKA